MDYCLPGNQISSYTCSSGTKTAKNIDCVTLEADLVACDALTIQGENVTLTGVSGVFDKTQNMSAVANETTHTGNFIGADLQTTRITPIDSTTGLSLLGNVDQSYSSTSSNISLYLTNPILSNGAYTGIQLGTSKTANYNAWQMLFNYTSSGSTTNRLDFKNLNQSTTLSLLNGKVGVNTTSPTEAFEVSGNARVSGTGYVVGTFTAGNNVTMTGSSAILSQTGTSASISQSGTSATASLKATTVTSLTASGNVLVAGTFGVTGAVTATGNITLSGTSQSFSQTGTSATASLKATSVTSLTNTGNETVGGTLGVTGNTTLSGTLGVTGATTTSILTNTGNASVGGTLGVTGTTTMTSLSTSGNATLGGTLDVAGNETVGGTLGVTGNTALSGTLAVTGAVTASNNITMSGTSASFTQSGTSATASLKATSVTSLTNTGNETIGGTLGVTGNTTLSGTLAVTGATTTSSLTNTGNATVGGTLGVTGNLTAAGDITMTGTSSYASLKAVGVTSFSASGSAGFQDTVDIIGTTTLSNDLVVNGATDLGGTLSVTGLATIGGTLGVTGGAAIGGVLGVTGSTSLTSLTTSGTATIGSTLKAPQLTQSLPGYYYYSTSSQSLTVSVENIIKYNTTSFSQGTLNLTYSSTTGIFTNSTGSAKAYLVSYTTYFAGASGGRRACYIRTSNTSGNAPQGTATDQEGTTNTAHSYQLGGDATAVKLSGSAPIILANGGSFSVYAYQSYGTLSLTGAHVLILSL